MEERILHQRKLVQKTKSINEVSSFFMIEKSQTVNAWLFGGEVVHNIFKEWIVNVIFFCVTYKKVATKLGPY